MQLIIEGAAEKEDSAEVFELFDCPECRVVTEMCEETKRALAEHYEESVLRRIQDQAKQVLSDQTKLAPGAQRQSPKTETDGAKLRQKRNRLPLTFKNSSELQLKSGRSEKSRGSQKSEGKSPSLDDFDYKSKDRIFGGDYSEQVSLENLTKKSVSMSDLSEFPFSRKASADREAPAKPAPEAPPSKQRSGLGSSFMFGEGLAGPWELQHAITCARHKGEEVMYWEAERKELLCGQCLLEKSPSRMRTKANLKNIHKSLPHLRQTIEDTVNDVNLQWQFLRNKRRELQICQGSLHTQRKSLENKFRIEIKEFFATCVDIRDAEVASLKAHFKGLSCQMDAGLAQVQEKVGFLGKVTQTFEALVGSRASPEKVIDFYCENVTDIDSQLGSVRALTERVEALGGKGLFQHSNEKTQIWFLKYLLGFYEKLSEFVFTRKTFFKEKLGSFEKRFRTGEMEIADLPSYLGNPSCADARADFDSNLQTRENQRVRVSTLDTRANARRGSDAVNFHSQMNNEIPSDLSGSEPGAFPDFSSPTDDAKCGPSLQGQLSALKEDVSRLPLDSRVFRGDSTRTHTHTESGSSYRKAPLLFPSRRSSKKTSLFAHKPQNFSHPVLEGPFVPLDGADSFAKFSGKKPRKKNFTRPPGNSAHLLTRNFGRKSRAVEAEEPKLSRSRPRRALAAPESKVNSSNRADNHRREDQPRKTQGESPARAPETPVAARAAGPYLSRTELAGVSAAPAHASVEPAPLHEPVAGEELENGALAPGTEDPRTGARGGLHEVFEVVEEPAGRLGNLGKPEQVLEPIQVKAGLGEGAAAA